MFRSEFEKVADRGVMLKKIVAEAQRLIDQQQSRLPHLQPHQREDAARKLEATRAKMNRAHALMKKGSAYLFPPGTMGKAIQNYNMKQLRQVAAQDGIHAGVRHKGGAVVKLIDLDPAKVRALALAERKA